MCRELKFVFFHPASLGASSWRPFIKSASMYSTHSSIVISGRCLVEVSDGLKVCFFGTTQNRDAEGSARGTVLFSDAMEAGIPIPDP